MKLTFTNQVMLLASVTARAEVHGDEREPASDLGLRAELPNDALNVFDKSLKSCLYHFDSERPKDLADQGKSNEPGFLPHLRFPMLGAPLHWDDEIANAVVRIKRRGETKELVLTPAKVNKFAIEPLDGGTVRLSIRVQYKPDEKQAGRLAMLVQQEVEVTLEIVDEEVPPA